MNKTVVELFAGVGGFRVGLNCIRHLDADGRAVENGNWQFVWANQWEPATKSQEAYDCYIARFGDSETSNEDISSVKKSTIPDHTLLVGGFPCQDYSVARSLSQEKGIEGKKGVLWWQINDILKIRKPKFVLLENVDRLLKSPSKQRGQAFGIMLRSFSDLGYGVQWKVINAADYGHVQRRRRIFIFAFHKSTNYYKMFSKKIRNIKDPKLALDSCMFARPFPSTPIGTLISGDINKSDYPSILDVSERFSASFESDGYCINSCFSTIKTAPEYTGKRLTLRDIIDESDVPEYCYALNLENFKYLKGAKKITRTSNSGFKYIYSEGAIPFPDNLDMPGRTMLTSEGTTNRSSHVIEDPVTHRLRFLSPVECERMDEFPDNWTDTGMSPKRRYFICGNALVCGLVEKMGEQISEIIDQED